MFIGVIVMIAVEAQAGAKSQIFNSFVCQIGGDVEVFELRENKTIQIKKIDSYKNKRVVLKGRWSKDNLKILIETYEVGYEEIGKGAWYPYGVLVLGRKGNITFNNPEMYDRPQKCFMK